MECRLPPLCEKTSRALYYGRTSVSSAHLGCRLKASLPPLFEMVGQLKELEDVVEHCDVPRSVSSPLPATEQVVVKEWWVVLASSCPPPTCFLVSIHDCLLILLCGSVWLTTTIMVGVFRSS